MKVKVIHHNDPDGYCAAFWARKYLQITETPFTSGDFIATNYDQLFPYTPDMAGSHIIILDYSCEPEIMQKMLDDKCRITWIDHHYTAIEKYKKHLDMLNQIAGIQKDGIAGCLLSWAYFFAPKLLHDNHIVENAPKFTQYIHYWDTWTWKDLPSTESKSVAAFITALTTKDLDPCKRVFWDAFTDSPDNKSGDVLVDLVTRNGYTMMEFRNGYAKMVCDSIGKTIEFEGFKCFAVNLPKCSSEWIKTVQADIWMPFYWNSQTNQFIVSLYTDKDIDVSKIAVKYGGGGHKQASGFQCQTLPW